MHSPTKKHENTNKNVYIKIMLQSPNDNDFQIYACFESWSNVILQNTSDNYEGCALLTDITEIRISHDKF